MKKTSKNIFLALVLIPALLLSAGCKRGEKDKVLIERWFPQKAMSQKRAGLGAVAAGNRIYAIGGGEFSAEGLKIFDSVEFAEVKEDGTVGEWKLTSPLVRPRVYLAAVVWGDHIYVMGGESAEKVYKGEKGERAPELLNTIERARINPNGTLGEWVEEKEKMHFPRRGGELYVNNGWLYAAGGFGGGFLNDVEKAKINQDGSIGRWEESSFIKIERYISGFAQKDGAFYVMGGHVNAPERAMDSVEFATANPDSSISEWKETSPLYTRRFLNTALVKDNTIYTFAGHNTVNLAGTERSVIQSDGTLGKWEPDTPLNVPRRAPAAVTVGDTIYVLGGMIKPMGSSDSVDIVESAKIIKDKKLGNWLMRGSEDYKAYEEWKNSVPQDAQNHVLHGKVFLPTGQFQTVLFDASEALKEYPRYVDAYLLQGETYQRMGKAEEAIGSLKKVLEIEDKNFIALMGLGLLHFEKEDFKNSMDYYKLAVGANPKSVDAHFNLGNVYLRIEDYPSATTEFQWVLEKDPKLEGAKHLLDISRKAQAKAK